MPKGAKMIPYLRTENLKNHTLSRGTYLYSPYMGVHPRAAILLQPLTSEHNFTFLCIKKKRLNIACFVYEAIGRDQDLILPKVGIISI